MSKKTVLCFSGGLDSTTLLYDLYWGLETDAICVGFDYGQSHRRELDQAAKIASDLDVPFELVKLDPTPFGQTALTAGGRRSQVIVPNRNAIFISNATAIAIREKADSVAIAVHGGDHEIWPDCRPRFLDAMAQVLLTCHTYPIQLRRPYVRSTKLDIVKLALSLGVPIEQTWTCYEGRDKPCETCVACLGRRQALFLAGATCTV